MVWTNYKTTNLINGKYYIGVHKTSNLNDSYLGSGHLIKRAVLKYGTENFKKDVLFTFDTKEEAYLKERELVVEAKSKGDGLCYNISNGGEGGYDYINENKLYVWDKPGWAPKLGKKTSAETKAKQSASHKGKCPHTWSDEQRVAKAEQVRGTKHKEETKLKMSQSRRARTESPQALANRIKAMQTPEYRAKLAESTKRLWQDSVFREKMMEARKKK